MYIKNIKIGKYRHLEDISLGPFLRPTEMSDLVVLAGPNGGGKTSILELISLALSSTWSLTYKLNRTAPSSAFEVTLGLLPGEIKLVEENFGDKTAPADKEAYDHLITHKEYSRSFNFSGGEYEKNTTLHNKIHSVVQQVLHSSYQRPLGFYLGSDRSFRARSFNNQNVFSYSTYTTYQHVMSFAFQEPSAQYDDMFNFLITWRYHFTKRLGQYILDLEAGDTTETDRPVDEYGDILARVFPGYRFVESPGDSPTDLFIKLPSNVVIPFSDLSSGEKEVFFLLSFYQRHKVEDAIIIIDETELHLHPSLARVLLKTMQEMKPNNQIWLATQSSEVIDHAGRDRVFFVRRRDDHLAEIVPSTDEEEALLCLRDFFGYSGYLGLAKAMVFTEGRNSSADRKTFSMITHAMSQEVKFIPAGGCSEVERINRAVLSILDAEVGWCQFYLIRDRDYLDAEMYSQRKNKSSDRLFILERHELENYLLDFELISKILTDIFDQSLSPNDVYNEFRECAIRISGNALRDMVTYRLNSKFQREDFSVPRILEGKLTYKDGNWDTDILTNLRSSLRTRCSEITDQLLEKIDNVAFDDEFEASKEEIELSLQSDKWVDLLPGKELLQQFSTRRGLPKPPMLQNLIIKEMALNSAHIPTELEYIIGRITA